MPIKAPQLDLPDGLRGGADTWDQPQASVILNSEFFETPPTVDILAAVETGPDTITASAAVWQGGLNTGALGEQLGAAQTVATGGETLRSAIVFVGETGADGFSATGTSASNVVGDMAATETGADTFAASGAAQVNGSLAAAETGVDTFAASGAAQVNGSLAATEAGDDVFFANGSGLPIAYGSLTATEAGADALSSVGYTRATGALAAAELESDTFAATGSVADVVIYGVLDAAEGADLFAGVGVTQGYATEQRSSGGSLFRGIADASVYAVSARSITRVGAPAVVVANPSAAAHEYPAEARAVGTTSRSRCGYARGATGGGATAKGATAATRWNASKALGVARQVALGRGSYARAIVSTGAASVYGVVHTSAAHAASGLGGVTTTCRGQFHTTAAGFSTARGWRVTPRSYIVAVAATTKPRKVVDSLPV
ncbi:MAG: hypothetical protein ACKOW0_00860 [Schleiferiaceae bacterium]